MSCRVWGIMGCVRLCVVGGCACAVYFFLMVLLSLSARTEFKIPSALLPRPTLQPGSLQVSAQQGQQHGVCGHVHDSPRTTSSAVPISNSVAMTILLVYSIRHCRTASAKRTRSWCPLHRVHNYVVSPHSRTVAAYSWLPTAVLLSGTFIFLRGR